MLVSVFSRLFTAVKGLVKQAKVDNQKSVGAKNFTTPRMCYLYKCVIHCM